jgi:tetratricopeptide (TPR) repeat protein
LKLRKTSELRACFLYFLAYRELGFCLYKQKKYQASEDALEEAIDITNNLQNEDVRVDRAKTLYNLALCYKATGRLRKMVPILEEAVDIMKGEHGLANNETLKMAGCLREVRKQLRSDL